MPRRREATEERGSERRDARHSGESSERISPAERRRTDDDGDDGDGESDERGELRGALVQGRTVSVRRKRRDGAGAGVIALTLTISSAASCTRPLSGPPVDGKLAPPLPEAEGELA